MWSTSGTGTGLPAADGRGVTAGEPRREPAGGDRRARHVVLVGLPGAGKSTVGPIVAAMMERPFVDLDEEIVRQEGRAIDQIFAAVGEAGFRAIETRVTREVFAGPPAVVAAGGGWVVSDLNIASAQMAALIVHLQVSPASAAGRIGPRSGIRPLLAAGDPVRRLHGLWESRRERYRRADVEVDTEGLEPEQVAAAVVRLIDRSGF